MFKNKKAVSLFLAVVMMFGMSTSTFAAENQGVSPTVDSGFSADEIPPEIGVNISKEELETLAQEMQENITDADGSFEVPNISSMVDIEKQDGEIIDVNTLARETWRITDSIFIGDGQLSAANPMDMYVISTTTTSTPVLKVNSQDSNVIAQLFILDASTGQATPTNFMDQAGDASATISSSLPIGDYILAVGSANNTSTSAYTLMWNRSNPANPSRVIYASPNLDLVTLGYGYQAIKSNGIVLINESTLEWEEHYTLTVGNSYWGRDQHISDVTINKIHMGTFSTNKYSTNNALLVEIGEHSLWSIMRSSYTNNVGDVTHVMDWNDATGQKTPRRFDAIDMQLGPHFIVIDLEENLVVDFASPYNYLWQSGDTKGSATLTVKDI